MAVSLFEVSDGDVRVDRLEGDEVEQRRLADLGLRLGSRLRILRHNGPGGLMVAVGDDTRLVLDPATARAIVVTRLEPVFPPLTLADLRPGDRARITALGKGKGDYRRRLMAMGLTPGVHFRITRVAPLGDPVEIEVRGFAMSLRRGEADLLMVEKQQ